MAESAPATDDSSTVCVADVRGIPEFNLQLFFESERRTGGGPIKDIQLTPDGDSAVIIFEESTVAKRVLDRKNIDLNGKLLKISRPAECDPCSVLVSDIPTTMDDFTLRMFLENERRSGGGNVKRLDRQSGASVALITFDDAQVTSRVLKKGPTLNLVGGGHVTVKPCPKPSAVQVHDVTANDKMMLHLYFENPRSGGGDVASVVIHNGIGIVTFENPQVVPSILERQHSLGDDRNLTVQPYIPELHPLPKENSAPAKPRESSLRVPFSTFGLVEFLRDTKVGQSWVQDRGAQCGFTINWQQSSDHELCVDPSMQMAGQGVGTAQWTKECEEEIKCLLMDVVAIDLAVPSANVDAVEQEIQNLSNSGSRVYFSLDKANKLLKITGFELDAVRQRDKMIDTMKAPHRAHEDQVLENELSLGDGQIRLLQISKHVDFMRSRVPSLDVSIGTNKAVMKGTERDLQQGYKILYDDFIANIISETFVLNGTKFALLANKDVGKLVEDLMERDKMVASLDVDPSSDSVTVYGLSDQDVTDVQRIVENLSEKTLSFTGCDKDVLETNRWHQIKTRILTSHRGSVVIEENKVQHRAKIVCTQSIVSSVVSILRDLEDLTSEESIMPLAVPTAILLQTYYQNRLTAIQRSTQVSFPDAPVNITCDLDIQAFIIKGSTDSIREASAQLADLLAGVLRDDHVVSTPTMPSYFLSSEGADFLSSVEQQNKAICVLDDNMDQLLKRQSSPRSTAPAGPPLEGATAAPIPSSELIRLQHGQTIRILAEDLNTCNTDVIIVPATNKFQHTQPTVIAMVQCGGDAITTACSEQLKIFTRDALLGTTCRTEAGKLLCNHVIHMVTNQGSLLLTEESLLNACIEGSLEDVKYQNLRSVALFICESKPKYQGNIMDKMQNIAVAIVQFLVFEAEHKVEDVHLVVMDTDIRALLHKAIMEICNNFGIELAASEPSAMDTSVSSPEAELGAVGGAPANMEADPNAVGGDSAQERESSPSSPGPEILTVSAYAMDRPTVDRVLLALRDKCDNMCQSVMLSSDREQNQIASLSAEQEQAVLSLQSEFTPWVVLEFKKEEHLNYIEIAGRTQQVTACIVKVKAILDGTGSEPESEEVDGAVAMALSASRQSIGDDMIASTMEEQDKFCWERRLESGNYEPYQRDISALLEIAYTDRQPTAEFVGYNDLRYSVDFHTMKQHSLSDGSKVSSVRRKGQQNGSASLPLPVTWTPMGAERFTMVTLDKNDQEYTDVEGAFRATCASYTIKQIDRIQNPGLYQQYQVKRQLIESTCSLQDGCERRLYHGTSVETLQHINCNGFNRGYCGKNATMYGKGVYFAREAEYSARRYYSPESDGKRYIYQCLVATGDYTVGNQSYVEPPPKEANNPNIRYDSVTDRMSNPEMFIIFHDSQAYPEYLITFC